MSTRGPFKHQTLDILRERGVPVTTVLDVGVCHGTPELVRAFPKARHILFEPVAEFADRIRTAYRNIDHVLHEVAIGEVSGSVTLQTMAYLDGMTISHSKMVAGQSADAPNHRTVPMLSIDDAVVRHGYYGPFLLKIDIDGQELKVLRGATETLSQCSVVIVECVRNELAQRIMAVQAAGFTLFDLCEPCYYDKSFWQCDVVFVRTELHQSLFQQLKGKVLTEKYEIFRASSA